MKHPFRYTSVLAIAITSSFSVYATDQAPDTAPDNSRVNVRDRDDGAKTADRQIESSRNSTEVTRMIRRELTKDPGLSTYAQNIKIITDESSVTLRGPVHTRKERAKIEQVARRTASNRAIRNELEIKQ